MRLIAVVLILLVSVTGTIAQTLEIVAVGDIMAHSSNIKSAQQKNGIYDFSEVFLGVKDILKTGDLTIGNLETRFAGKERGFTGYPAFNCPEELAIALKDVGFNYLVTANNHSLDRGYSGIVATNAVLDKYGILHTGTYSTQEESSKISVFEKKGMKIAILNYTYGTNGITLPKDKSFAVSYINNIKIESDIKRAELISDYIIVFLHFGNEYEVGKPNSTQTGLVKKIFAAGADLVLGSHPHVVQNTEELSISYQNKQKKVFVAYSMGNFVSGQTAKNTDIGQIIKLTIAKPDNSKKQYSKRLKLYRQDAKEVHMTVDSDIASWQKNFKKERISLKPRRCLGFKINIFWLFYPYMLNCRKINTYVTEKSYTNKHF